MFENETWWSGNETWWSGNEAKKLRNESGMDSLEVVWEAELPHPLLALCTLHTHIAQ